MRLSDTELTAVWQYSARRIWTGRILQSARRIQSVFTAQSWTKLLLLNLLNLLDAQLTYLGLRLHLLTEFNPVIRVIGFPAKLVLVLVASTILSILNPRALLIPIVALALVCTYTITGLLIGV